LERRAAKALAATHATQYYGHMLSYIRHRRLRRAEDYTLMLAKPYLSLKHAGSRLLHSYANFRVGAKPLERACYKQSDSILLTFDDYGTPEEVGDILRILDTKQVKAAFFLQGNWAQSQPEQVERIAAKGHVLGNHTVNHRVLTQLEPANVYEEISGGLPGPWFRPPQGRYNQSIRKIAKALGYVICYWSIDSRDWTGASVEEMRYTIMTEIHPGATILFHLHGKHTRDLLPSLIDDIRTQGYQLTAHDETWQPV
jgi:peptidoglycan/xylan/chitin deacetylase (PgdA/CDA1 family)